MHFVLIPAVFMNELMNDFIALDVCLVSKTYELLISIV